MGDRRVRYIPGCLHLPPGMFGYIHQLPKFEASETISTVSGEKLYLRTIKRGKQTQHRMNQGDSDRGLAGCSSESIGLDTSSDFPHFENMTHQTQGNN